MVELNQQIDSLQKQMNDEAGRTVEELQNEVTIADNKVAGLVAIRQQSRSRPSRLPMLRPPPPGWSPGTAISWSGSTSSAGSAA